MPYIHLSEDSIDTILALPGLPRPLQVHLKAARQPGTAAHRWLIRIAREELDWIGAVCVEIRDDAPVEPLLGGRVEVMAWLTLHPQGMDAEAESVSARPA